MNELISYVALGIVIGGAVVSVIYGVRAHLRFVKEVKKGLRDVNWLSSRVSDLSQESMRYDSFINVHHHLVKRVANLEQAAVGVAKEVEKL